MTLAPDTENPDAEEKPKLSRTVVALGFVSLFTDMSSEMVYTQVPVFLIRVLGAPPWVIGVIEGIAESTASLFRLVSGRISDRIGRRKPLTLLGYGFGAVSKPLMALSTAWGGVLALRFLDRLGKGLRSAPRDALITETTPKAIRGRAFGFHRAMDTTGAVFGPLLGLWFLGQVGGDLAHRLRSLFLFAGIPGLLAVLTLFIFVREKALPQNAEPKASAPLRFRWSELTPEYRRFLGAMLVFTLGNSSDAFLMVRAGQLGFSSTQLLWLYAAFNLVEAFLGYAAGKGSDRVGRRPLIVAGLFVYALVYLGFAVVTPGSRGWVWVLFLLYGGYSTLTGGAQRAFAADLSDPERRATQIGAYHTVLGFALLPASLIAGWLFGQNPAFPFFFGSVFALLGAVLLSRNVSSRFSEVERS